MTTPAAADSVDLGTVSFADAGRILAACGTVGRTFEQAAVNGTHDDQENHGGELRLIVAYLEYRMALALKDAAS